MPVGKRIKQARQELGLSLEELEEKTKIRKVFLQAIEEENYEQIPGEAYITAFIRGYANQLGLNGQQLVRDYNNILAERTLQEKENKKKEQKNNFIKNNSLNFIIILILILVIFVIIYNIVMLNKNEEELLGLVNLVITPLLTSLLF